MNATTISFYMAKSYLEKGQFDALSRTSEQLKQYEEWTSKTLAHYESIADFIKHKVFGHSASRNQKSGKIQTLSKQQQQNQPSQLQVILRQNDFPYSFDHTARHYCLWANRELSSEFVQQYLDHSLPGRDKFWFINPPQKKSIRELWHVHVIIKNGE